MEKKKDSLHKSPPSQPLLNFFFFYLFSPLLLFTSTTPRLHPKQVFFFLQLKQRPNTIIIIIIGNNNNSNNNYSIENSYIYSISPTMHKPVRISASTLKSWMDNPQQPFVVIDVRDHDAFGVSILSYALTLIKSFLIANTLFLSKSPINSFFQGHIRHSINIPAANFVPSLPSLSSSLCNTKRVVFHCQLSQSRGPACAMAYLRHISHIFPNQEIFILDGGFNEWARLYGRDPRYTEAL